MQITDLTNDEVERRIISVARKPKKRKVEKIYPSACADRDSRDRENARLWEKILLPKGKEIDIFV